MAEADYFQNYLDLIGLIDRHNDRVTTAYADELTCRQGCTACCRQDLGVSRVEATSILAWLAQNGLADHDPARTPHDDHPFFDDLSGGDACAFLTRGGGCGIYPVRPLICRTHGLPIKLEDGVVDTCPLNFVGRIDVGYTDIPGRDLLDLANLNLRFSLIETLFCRQEGEPPLRVPLSQLRAMAQELLEEEDDQ